MKKKSNKKELYSVSEVEELLGLTRNTILNYIFEWQDEFVPATAYSHGPLGAKVRFYNWDAVGKIAKFVDTTPMVRPFFQRGKRLPKVDIKLMTCAATAREVGLSINTVRRWVDIVGLSPLTTIRGGKHRWNYFERNAILSMCRH
ncbi:hypothetical protein HWQ67_18460, partial [Candidatus Magnetobacterium casensis]